MPHIILNEIDDTKSAVALAETDVAFVPGIANTNFNVFITQDPDVTPTDIDSAKATGTLAPKKGDTFVNTFDKKQWKYTTKWDDDNDNYKEPSPMNAPTYCASTNEFKNTFGAEPYTWKENDTRTLPTFGANELPGAGTHYFYKANDTEISWLYAMELIYEGMPVYFEDVADLEDVGVASKPIYRKKAPSLTTFYARLESTKTGKPGETGYDGTHGVYTNYELLDIGEFYFKYITSGGYPTFNKTPAQNGTAITSSMIELCTNRGDCYAIIDHCDNVLRPWYGATSLFSTLNPSSGTSPIADDNGRATMFTPWATYTTTFGGTRLMPGSFAYLKTLANGIKFHDDFLAYAGVNRGGINNIGTLHCKYPLTNTVANDLQPRSGAIAINPITYIKPYGLTIWGNRTLKKAGTDLKASNFLNIRNLVCEIQKIAYESAKVCLFENDTVATWTKFTTPINEKLNSMQLAGALASYSITRSTTEEKAKIVATIKVRPTYAVEDFQITVILTDEDVTVNA